MDQQAKAWFQGLVIGVLSAVESFFLSVAMVRGYAKPPKPVSEFSGFGILAETVVPGLVVAVVVFFVSVVLVIRNYRPENERTFRRITLTLLGAVAILAAAIALRADSSEMLWAIILSAVMLLGGVAMLTTHRVLAAVVAGSFLFCLWIAGWLQTHPANANPPVTSYQIDSFEFQDSGIPQVVRGATVTADFFPSVNAVPWLGRLFLPEEYRSGRQQVVVLSHRFWQKRFGADSHRVGSTMYLNGRVFTIVGVMPATFQMPSGAEIWVPR